MAVQGLLSWPKDLDHEEFKLSFKGEPLSTLGLHVRSPYKISHKLLLRDKLIVI